jgi:small subunit ribosomal protein S8
MVTDPIADMLTRIRNAGQARHVATHCPASRQKLAVARVLKQAGFLGDVSVEARDGHPVMVLGIRYDDRGRALIDGIRRVSKPGRRVYVGREEIPRVRRGLGIAVLSTSKGVMSDRDARQQKIGGELLCEVW